MPDNSINVNNKYLTYRYIIEQFNTIQEKHRLLNTFFSGPMEEIDINGITKDEYPILYIEPSGIEVNNYIQTFTFEVAILDKFLTEESYNQRRQKQPEDELVATAPNQQGNYSDLYSNMSEMRDITMNDSYSAFQDVIASFIQNYQSISWINTEVDLQLPINLTPVSTQYDNMLSGWTGTFRITANNKNDLCKAMIENQE